VPTTHFWMENAFLPIFHPVILINGLKTTKNNSYLYSMFLSNKTKTNEYVCFSVGYPKGVPTTHFWMENALLPIFHPVILINGLKTTKNNSYLYGMFLSNKTKTNEYVCFSVGYP
jgi:hypothetical protein